MKRYFVFILDFFRFFLAGTCLTIPTLFFANNVSTDSQLNDAIILANTGADTTINFTSPITLSGGFPGLNLRPVNAAGGFSPTNQTITINGNGFSLMGGGAFRGFFIRGGSGSVAINGLTFTVCNGIGGSGGDVDLGSGGGGGGPGLGGALFIETGATVTLTDPVFFGSMATGGSGGSLIAPAPTVSGGGGGGGFRGNGGDFTVGVGIQGSGTGGGGLNSGGGPISASTLVSASGGGAVGPIAALAPVGNSGSDGANNFNGVGGGAGGGAATSGSPGILGGGGGGGGNSATATAAGSGGAGSIGAGGGGGALNSNSGAPGSGGIGGDYGGGGGGGGSMMMAGGAGGAGGFAGGGGGGGMAIESAATPGAGGTGGFGAGGGGGGSGVGAAGAAGSPGFGGGAGGVGSPVSFMDPGGLGGGGAGFGGAIFLQNGADLTVEGSMSFALNSTIAGAAGGAGAESGMTAGSDIFMMSSSHLTFDLFSNAILLNPIEGDIGAGGGSQTAGGITKKGPAQLILSGANTYTGTTRVSAGELQINGSIISEVIVEDWGTLSGNFSCAVGQTNPANGNLINSGTLRPGDNGIGVIAVEGDYIQTSTGTLAVAITAEGQSGRLWIDSGTATLDGTLNVFITQGNYVEGTKYEIINAPTLGTQFATVVASGPPGSLVNIQIDYSSLSLTVLTNQLFINQIIDSGIPSEVANCFTSVTITPFSDFAIIAELLGKLSNRDVNKALISLSPVRFGALEWINARSNSYIADLLAQHLFEICCEPTNRCTSDCGNAVWINVYGNLMENTKRFDNLRPFDANGVGALAGIDFACGCNIYLGISIGYQLTHLIWRNQGGKGNLNHYYGALYGSWQCNCFSIDFSAIGGGIDQNLERQVAFTGIDRVAKSDPWAYFATGHLGLRCMWDWGCTTFEPFAIGDYHYYSRDGFTEKGADSINLKVRSKDQQIVRAEGGLKIYGNFTTYCYCLAPYIGLSWVGEFPLDTSKQKATFIDQDCLMDVTSYDSSVQLASAQTGIKWTCFDGGTFTLGYKGLFNNRTHINQVEGRFEWIF